MLKAKLVVKQGQEVMGLYVKDRQTAHPKRYLFPIHEDYSAFFSPLLFDR